MTHPAYGVLLSIAFLFFGRGKEEQVQIPRHELAPRHHDLLVEYARIRERQMEHIARKRDIKIAREYRKFFEAATEGDWDRADKLYGKFRLKSGQWLSKKELDPDIGNELWQPVHEVGWAYRIFTTWDPVSIDLFARGILDSIPDDSIFFGGTDAGRFIITAFQAVEGRPNIVILTQNQLADMRYVHYIQDLYGKEIWLPSEADMKKAYEEYVKDMKAGRRPAHGQFKIVDGRVQITGALGMMEVNGILTRKVFERNRDTTPCYIEESYVLRWMYPYLEPHGLIMKLNPKPGRLSDEVVKKDMAFWTDYIQRLTTNGAFLRDRPARRAFAKLRCGIAGLYAARGKLAEAEKAFRQALAIDPSSPEANYRIAQEVYARQGRYDDIRKLMRGFRKQEPLYDTKEHRNEKIDKFVKQINTLESRMNRLREIEAEAKGGQLKLRQALELAELYLQTNQHQRFGRLADTIAGREDLPVDVLPKLSELYHKGRDNRRANDILERYLAKKPRDWKAWLSHAVLQIDLGNSRKVAEALQKAIDIGGKKAITTIMEDKRLKGLSPSPGRGGS